MTGFARLFKFYVPPGQQQAYDAYLRDVVTPIDAAAHASGVFESLITITPRRPGDWNHGRLFTFANEAQREAFAGRMAGAAMGFDGSEAARDARKAHAETLRTLIGSEDYDFTDPHGLK